jgi:hypothetical protein
MEYPLQLNQANSDDREIPVHIRIQNGTLSVLPDSVAVSKTARQHVHWFCPDGTITKITFDEPHPFASAADAFSDKRTHHHVVTTPARKTAREGQPKYKYTIEVSVNKKLYTADPDVEVMP